MKRFNDFDEIDKIIKENPEYNFMKYYFPEAP